MKLGIVGVIGMASAVALADTQTVDGVVWHYLTDEGRAIICSGERDEYGWYVDGPAIDAAVSGDLSIPSELGGLPVGKVCERAFKGCSKVTSITVPPEVESIDEEAFLGCAALTNVVLSEGVSGVSPSAFDGCARRPRVVLPNSIRDFKGGLGRMGMIVNFDFRPDNPWVRRVGEFLCDRRMNTVLGYCGRGKRLVIPDGIVRIGDEAFGGLPVEKVVLPPTLEEIGNEAFEGCDSIVTVEIPASVRKIGNCAFRCCRSLSGVFYRGRRVEVADSAFSRCGHIVSFVPRNAGWENEAGVLAGCRKARHDVYENAYWVPDGASLDKFALLMPYLERWAKGKDPNSCKVLAKLYGDGSSPVCDLGKMQGMLEAGAAFLRQKRGWEVRELRGWFYNRLGEYWMNGVGGQKDMRKAQEYFNQAIEGGNQKAMVNLARCLMSGDGMEKSTAGAHVLALACITRARWSDEYVLSEACELLGDWMQQGIVPGGRAKALEMYEKAFQDPKMGIGDFERLCKKYIAYAQ